MTQLLSLDCSILPLKRTLQCWVLSKEVSSTTFWVFWYDSTWEWISVSRTIGEHSTTKPMGRSPYRWEEKNKNKNQQFIEFQRSTIKKTPRNCFSIEFFKLNYFFTSFRNEQIFCLNVSFIILLMNKLICNFAKYTFVKYTFVKYTFCSNMVFHRIFFIVNDSLLKQTALPFPY